ncbi:gastrin/cholecystokinin type B receptor-like [Branchiostoma floridae x Branchiostoma belcheri]
MENVTCLPVPQDVLNALLDRTYARQMLPVIVYLLVLCPVGALGNLLVIVVNGARRNKSSSTCFILALAGADFLISAAVVPMKVFSYYHITYTSSAWCKINPYLITASVLSSTFLLIAIAADRFYAVYWPVQYLSVRKGRVLAAIAGTLLLGGVVAIPVVLDYQVVGGIRVGPSCSSVSQCYVTDSTNVTVLFIVTAVLFFLSVLIMAVLYALVYYRVSQLAAGIPGQSAVGPCLGSGCAWRGARGRRQDPPATSTSDIALRDVRGRAHASRGGRKNRHGNSQQQVQEEPPSSCTYKSPPTPASFSQASQHQQAPSASPPPSASPVPSASPPPQHPPSASAATHRHYRVAKLLLLVTLVFVLSWLPFWVLSLYEVAHPGYLAGKPTALVQAVALINDLYFVNNAANPIIYTFVQKSFRQRVMRLFRCCRCW